MRPLVLYLSLSLFLSLLPPSSAFPALLLPLGLASPPRAAMVASARRPSPLGISMIDFFTPPPVPTGDPSPIVHVSEQGDLEDLLEQGMETVTAVCVSWHLPSCRKCLALKARFRRIAKDPPCPCIFADADASLIELTDGRPAGPSRLTARCGISAFPTIQVWFMGRLKGEVVGGEQDSPEDIAVRIRTLLVEASNVSREIRSAGVGVTKQAYEEAHNIAIL